MRIRIIAALAVAALAVSLAGIAAASGTSVEPDKAVPRGHHHVKKSPVKFAQAAALVDSTGEALRNKGFRKFKHVVDSGEYCLLLPKGVNGRKIVAVAGPEYDNSPNTSITAQWRSGASDCQNGTDWLEVRTFVDSNNNTTWDLTDQAFSVVVP